MKRSASPSRALGLTLLLAFSSAGCSENHEVLVWEFPIGESQVRNGPEPDGSTNSPGRGQGRIEFDPRAREFRVRVVFEDLVGDLSKLHIHGPAGAESSTPRHVIEFLGPPEVPEALQTGTGVFETRVPLTATFQSDFPPLPPDAVVTLLTGGQTYLNVHTTVFGMGEIRGNLGMPRSDEAQLDGVGDATRQER